MATVELGACYLLHHLLLLGRLLLLSEWRPLSLEPVAIASLAAVGPFAVFERVATVELGTLQLLRPLLLLGCLLLLSGRRPLSLEPAAIALLVAVVPFAVI